MVCLVIVMRMQVDVDEQSSRSFQTFSETSTETIPEYDTAQETNEEFQYPS